MSTQKKHVHPALPKALGTYGFVFLAAAVTCLILLPPLMLLSSTVFSAPLEHDHPTPLVWASIGFWFPLAVFGALDSYCDSSHWWVVGARRAVPSDTSDPPREGRFILRLRNAHSSNALVSAGCYELALVSSVLTKASLASALSGCTLLALGIASYVWWASEAEMACRVDNFLMEAYFVSVSLLIGSIVRPEYETPLCSVVVTAMAARWVYAQRAPLLIPAALVETAVLVYATSMWAILELGSIGNPYWAVSGVCCIIFGLVPKVSDVKGELVCGTAVFHFLEAYGFAALFLWAQTLPNAE